MTAPLESAQRRSTNMPDATGPEASRGREGVGICLSGGGYRAALFHLGALRRLNELGILAQSRTISGASGGAIAATLLGDPRLVWPTQLHGSGGTVLGFDEYVAAPLIALTSSNVRTPALLSKLLPTKWFVRDAAVRALSDQFVKHVPNWATPLRQSETGPGIIVAATDISYGVDWVFMNPAAARPHGRIGDYRIGYAVPPASLRLADGVAASCAAPPFFAPLRLDGRALGLTGGSPGPVSPELRREIRGDVQLGDGGIYDDLALEPVWKSHHAVFVSDGGGVFRATSTRTLYGRLLQVLAIATGGGGTTRMRWLIASMVRGVLDGATWALDSVVPHSYPPEVCGRINAIRTDLDAFSTAEQHILERHGYLVADHATHRHADALITIEAALVPPHDEVAEPQAALRALRTSDRRTLLGRF